ncbi:MAG: glycoside hydrolase family 88 protein [Clostridia bacterium]|nr:glycoside hydrolase family 88 protein [Clostridia bacterium]
MPIDFSQMDELAQSVLSAMLCMQRHAWEQGLAMEAVRAMGRDGLLYRMARDAVVRQHADGRTALVGGETVATDPCSIGGPLLYIAKQRNDPELLAGASRLLRWARLDAPRSSGGLVYHFLGSREIWADSIYMLPPFLAEAGYPEEAVRLIDGYFDCLMDGSGLLAHRYNDANSTFINSAHWGIGNGWALCALVRVLSTLRTHTEWMRIRNRICALLDAILPFMCSDGRFHNVLDDPATFAEIHYYPL